MQSITEADPYVWVEPFRDLTLEEFRARERIKFETAERLRVELSDKLQETLKSVPIGSMIKTHDNRNWIVQETPDGRRVMLIDTRPRKVRRAAEKAEGTIRL